MRQENPARKILDKIKDEQFKLDTAIAKGDNKAKERAEKNIRNLKKDFAKLSEDS